MNRKLSIGMALVAFGIVLGTVSLFTFGEKRLQLALLAVSAIDMLAGGVFLYLGTREGSPS